MDIFKTEFQDLFLIKRSQFEDTRGSLRKLFFLDFFQKIDFHVDDIYITTSKKHAVRGLHHQIDPFGQAKMISCLRGSFIDIAVDLRKGSSTHKQAYVKTLTEGDSLSILVPAGFSHGTYSLEDGSSMLSICSGEYMPEHERGISIRSISQFSEDQKLILSNKDMALPMLDEYLQKI